MDSDDLSQAVDVDFWELDDLMGVPSVAFVEGIGALCGVVHSELEKFEYYFDAISVVDQFLAAYSEVD